MYNMIYRVKYNYIISVSFRLIQLRNNSNNKNGGKYSIKSYLLIDYVIKTSKKYAIR